MDRIKSSSSLSSKLKQEVFPPEYIIDVTYAHYRSDAKSANWIKFWSILYCSTGEYLLLTLECQKGCFVKVVTCNTWQPFSCLKSPHPWFFRSRELNWNFCWSHCAQSQRLPSKHSVEKTQLQILQTTMVTYLHDILVKQRHKYYESNQLFFDWL